MQDEKIIETSLQNLIGRIADIKLSLQNFMWKLEHEPLAWPQVLDNFALISGQINTLNKVLKNDRMPLLRNLCILPILVSQDRDEELTAATENRIPVFNHEIVPDCLRTKYEPVVELEEQRTSLLASQLTADVAQQQVASLNNMVVTLLELIQSAKDEWDTESEVHQDDLTPSEKDTQILLAAMVHGAGLRKRPESGRSRVSSKPQQPRTTR